ncbi:MAG TPA: hypothetical protein DIC64_01430 [Alphaproteobacteria bacterium]|nr:hypothetical protein [Alphaproteobacteria bacterium]
MAETYKTPQEHPLYELAKKYRFNPNIKVANPNALKIELDRIVKYVKMKFDQNKLSEEDKATYQRYLQDQEAEKAKKAEEAEKQEATAVGAPSVPSPEPASTEKNVQETTPPASEAKLETKTLGTKLDTPENPLMKERFYRLALRLKEAGIEIWDISKYDASNPDFGTQINKDLNNWIQNNKPEVNAQALAVFPKSSKLYHILEQKIKQAEKNKEDTHREKKEEKQMEENTEDLSAQFKASDVYKNAVAAGIDVSGYAPKTKEEFEEVKKQLTEKLAEYNKGQESSGKDAPSKDTPSPESHPKNRGSLTVSQTEQEETLDNSWIIETRQNQTESAESKGLTYQEVDPENLSKTSLEFELLKDGQSYGKLKYTARDHAQISADSKFEAYQGLVHDAIKKDLNIAADNSMTDAQKLMLYAAVLENKNIQMINAPKINLDSDSFRSLDKNVQDILKKEIERQKEAAKEKEAAEEKEGVSKTDSTLTTEADKAIERVKKAKDRKDELSSVSESTTSSATSSSVIEQKRGIAQPETTPVTPTKVDPSITKDKGKQQGE